MQSLAIIGSGISGLGAAYYLRNDFRIDVFEKNDYVGGHTNTVTVEDGGRPLPVDTGFIVYNETTYPNLTRLFAELGVATHESDMSFGMHNQNSGLQFSGQNLGTLFAQRSNVLRPKYWKFLMQADRFNNEAPVHLEQGLADAPLYEYLKEQGYDDYFVFNFIVPMGSAVWSTPVDRMLEFPAAALIRFFRNHGFLGMTTQLPWRTVTNGSHSYVRKILDHLEDAGAAVHTGEGALGVHRDARGSGVIVRTEHGEYSYDRVLLAVHGDQALRLLEDPTAEERELLAAYKYEANRAVLHTDESVMPPLRRVWSSWNYKSRQNADGGTDTATVYWMNRLQNLPTKTNYFVSINDFEDIDPAKVVRSIDYEHPLFSSKAIEYQSRLDNLNARGPLYFAGSYFRYGFHEDGLISGLRVVEKLSSERFRLLSV